VGFGRLPGDVLIDRENFTIYIPITTGLLFSIALSVMLWLSIVRTPGVLHTILLLDSIKARLFDAHLEQARYLIRSVKSLVISNS
jgi:hypothetical protein